MHATGGQTEILNPGEFSSSPNLAAEMNDSKMNELERRPGASSEDMKAEDEQFHCVICLDLAYKPTVQACGHMFCFWCMHQAMSNVGVSNCPLCRSPYNHFPRICELLHFFLLKAFPVAYRQRAEQVLEEERTRGTFSPQFDDPQTAETVDAGLKLDISSCLETSSLGKSSQGDLITESGLAKECNNIIYAADRLNNGTQSRHSSSLCCESSSSLEKAIDINTCVPGSEVFEKTKPNLNLCDKVSVDDVLCCFCKELLYRPTVLNCGHAFCESCISINEEGKLKCEACQSLHPGDRPNVCLELHNYMEQVFPVEYAERKKSVLVQQEMHQQSKEDYGTCTQKDGGATAETPQNQCPRIMVHPYVGCDSCGMMPIIGKRFTCQDCPEKIGFDLCESCYERGPMHLGRFNQQHTAEHSFKEIAHSVFDQLLVTSDLLGPFLWTGPRAANPEDQQDDNGYTVHTRQWPASGNSTQSSDTPD